jgi:hypothetical protein
MNKTIGVQLAVYSLSLAGLSFLVHHLAPALARPTLIAGLAGGVLCLVWGIRAMAGSRGKALPILTLIPVNFTLLSQTFMGWSGGNQGVQDERTAAVVITLLLVMSLAMLVRIAWAGVVFDMVGAEPAKDAGGKPQMAGKPAGHANAAKHA